LFIKRHTQHRRLVLEHLKHVYLTRKTHVAVERVYTRHNNTLHPRPPLSHISRCAVHTRASMRPSGGTHPATLGRQTSSPCSAVKRMPVAKICGPKQTHPRAPRNRPAPARFPARRTLGTDAVRASSVRSHLDEPGVDYGRRFLAKIQCHPEVGVLPCNPETQCVWLCLCEDPGMQGGTRRAEAARAAASTRAHGKTCATIVHLAAAPRFRFIGELYLRPFRSHGRICNRTSWAFEYLN
jgi:hypothetical protein